MTRGGTRGKKQSERIGAIAERMGQELSRIRRAMRQPLDAEVAKGQLTAPQMSAMQVIVQNHGISLKDLSCTMCLAHSTVSGIVDRLEKRGLIDRWQDPSDGRLSRIYPTAVVMEFVKNRIPSLVHGPLEAALARTTAGERASIELALKRLRELLEKR